MTVVADRPAAGAEELLQRRAEVAAGQAVQVQQRQHLGHLRGLAAHAGRIAEENRRRSPVASSMRLSLTRGAATGTAPAPVDHLRGRAWPLRTTSRRPSPSTSSAWAST